MQPTAATSFSETVRRKVQIALDDHPQEEIVGPAFCPLRRIHWESDWQSRIARDLVALPTKWEVCLPTPHLHNELPPAQGLYLFVWRAQLPFVLARTEQESFFHQILYIGKAANLATRFQNEYRKYLEKLRPNLLFGSVGHKRENLFRAYLTIEGLEYWYCELPEFSQSDIDSLELRLIKFFNPLINDKSKLPSVRIHPKEPAFK